jgi:3-phosphoshikimate 1-carboxyvinyltransferase
MDVIITPGRLCGAVTPPPSKSQAHRLILCAALAEGTSTLRHVAFSEDIRATLSCVAALGAKWTDRGGGTITVEGIGGRRWRGGLPRLDCGESGSTLRFLIPVALAVAGGGVFTGRGRLMQRPQDPYRTLLEEKGVRWEQQGNTLTVQGTLRAGEYRLPGDVSSQFFTGLLLALPLAEGHSAIVPTTAVDSADYITMTRQAQSLAGVESRRRADGAFLTGHQTYRPLERTVENDWSQAAFWYAAAHLGSGVTVAGMDNASAQGDRRITDFAAALGRDGDVTLDVSQCPDLVPPLAAMAAVRRGRCRLTGAARLRMKESDRLSTVTGALRALGADIREEPAALVIQGAEALRGGAGVDCCGDHRIAMMAAVAATACTGGAVRLRGAECVRKSYPDFWEVYQSLGGKIHVIDLG